MAPIRFVIIIACLFMLFLSFQLSAAGRQKPAAAFPSQDQKLRGRDRGRMVRSPSQTYTSSVSAALMPA